MKTVSLVIPVFNEEKHIARCLKSVSSLQHESFMLEIIVVDNGSTDRTMNILQSFIGKLDLTILVYRDGPVSAVRNAGVRAASGSIVAFLDADCTASSDWIKNALPYYCNESDVAIVGSSYVVPESYGWVAKVWDMTPSKNRKNGAVNDLAAGNMIVDRKKFEQVGGFNEQLITNEDYDLCFRLRDQGYTIVSDNTVMVCHWGTPDSLTAFYKQTRWHGRHVYKVFFDDLKQKRNAKVVFYGLYYLALHLYWLIAVLFFHTPGVLGLLIFLSIAPPYFLAWHDIQSFEFIRITRLAVLNFVYGIARAHSVFDIIKGI